MANESPQLVAFIAQLRDITDNSIRKLHAQNESDLQWFRNASGAVCRLLSTAVESPPPALRPRSRSRRPPRPRAANVKPPAPSIRKTRRAAKAEQMQIITNAAGADKENVENEQLAKEPPLLPAKRITRAQRAAERAPLAPVRTKRPTDHVDEPSSLSSKRRSRTHDSPKLATAQKEKPATRAREGSNEKRSSTPFHSARSGRTDPDGKKISAQLAPPDFQDASDRHAVYELRNAPSRSKADEMPESAAELERTSSLGPQLGRPSTSHATDAPVSDVVGDVNRLSEKDDAMDISSDEGSLRNSQGLKKRIHPPAGPVGKVKARPTKTARTEGLPESQNLPDGKSKARRDVHDMDISSDRDDEVDSECLPKDNEEAPRTSAETSQLSGLSKMASQAELGSVTRTETGKETVGSEPMLTKKRDCSTSQDASDYESPVIRRRRRLRKRDARTRSGSFQQDENIVEILPTPVQILGEGLASLSGTEKVLEPKVLSKEVHESPSPQQLYPASRGEHPLSDTRVKTNDPEAGSPPPGPDLLDEDPSQSVADSDRSDGGHVVSMETEEPQHEMTQGRRLNPSSSPIVKYKIPKPRQRRAPVDRSSRLDTAPGATSRSSAVKVIPQTPLGRTQRIASTSGLTAQSGPKLRFIVDENGKLGRQGIGALSEIISTPSTVGRGLPVSQTGEDHASIRSKRLFRPTTNLYSAKKSGTLPAQRALGSNASAQILRTPGARTPGKSVPADSRSYPQSRMNKFNMLSLATPGNNTYPSMAGNAAAVLPITTTATVGDISGRHNRPRDQCLAFGDIAYDNPKKPTERPRVLNKELKFSFAKQGLPRSPQQHVGTSPGRNASKNVDLNSSGESFSHLPLQAKTAPGKSRPRPRIDGKMAKSALRCKVEKMLAAKTRSTSQYVDEDGDPLHPETSVKPSVSPEKVVSKDDLSIGEFTNTQKPPLDEDPDASGVKKASFIQPASDFKSRDEPSQRNRLSVRPYSSHKKTSSARVLSSDDLLGMNEAQHSVGIASGDDGETLDVDSNGEENVGEVASGGHLTEPYRLLDNVVPEKEINAEEVQSTAKSLENDALNKTAGPSTLSNLVSSVSSFLPAASTLFGARTEQKTEEKTSASDAKLALKRHRQDIERREAEVIARREAQRMARQKEIEEKQRKAEQRRQVLAEAERHRDEERRRKEEMRARKRQEEEEKQRLRKEEEDKRKEEHRRRVLEQKRQLDKAAQRKDAQRKDADAKRLLKGSKIPRAKLGQHGADGNVSKLKQRPGQNHPRLPPTGSSRIAKVVSSDSIAPSDPKTPKIQRDAVEAEEPQWVMTGERKRGFSETSSDEHDRRRHKTVPSWAASQKLWKTLQAEKSDPDSLFARGAPSCNLETVFDVDEEKKRKYRVRDDSGDWTKDRLTSQEEMQYKRQAGFFDNA